MGGKNFCAPPTALFLNRFWPFFCHLIALKSQNFPLRQFFESEYSKCSKIQIEKNALLDANYNETFKSWRGNKFCELRENFSLTEKHFYLFLSLNFTISSFLCFVLIFFRHFYFVEFYLFSFFLLPYSLYLFLYFGLYIKYYWIIIGLCFFRFFKCFLPQ